MKRLVLIAVLALMLVGCGTEVPETPDAFKYRVVKEETQERAAINRTRLQVDIVPIVNADLNQKSMAETVMRAAIDKADSTGVDVVFVYLWQDESIFRDEFLSPLARCTYAPDGKDIGGDGNMTWDVSAAHEQTPMQVVDMARLWKQERHKFVGPKEFEINGQTIIDEEYLDEDALISHLAKIGNVLPDKVSINHIKAFAEPYFKK